MAPFVKARVLYKNIKFDLSLGFLEFTLPLFTYHYSSNGANSICRQLEYTGPSSYSRAGLVRLEFIELIIFHVSQVLKMYV